MVKKAWRITVVSLAINLSTLFDRPVTALSQLVDSYDREDKRKGLLPGKRDRTTKLSHFGKEFTLGTVLWSTLSEQDEATCWLREAIKTVCRSLEHRTD